MVLIQSLRRHFTSSKQLVWLPPKNAMVARALNDIMMAEETDDYGTEDFSKAISHYHLFLQAMTEIGANTKPITYFISRLEENVPWNKALSEIKELYSDIIHPHTIDYLENTMNVCEHGTAAEIAIIFFGGREGP